MINGNSQDISIRLFCEYQPEPIGVQNKNPRFSWIVDDILDSSLQTAWQILVAETEEDLKTQKALLWDSGKHSDRQSTGIEYNGPALHSSTIYYWMVVLWTDLLDTPLKSPVGRFETAYYNASDWKGQWIQAPTHQWGVSCLFVRRFSLDEPILTARISISGLGYYELKINGVKVGDRQLDPGWTDYRRRVLYTIYDIRDYLQPGLNILSIELGEGWYGLEHPSFIKYFNRYPDWHGTPKLICDLSIELTNGEKISINSEPGISGGWYCAAGPVQENSIYDGEIYDARLEIEDISSVSLPPGEDKCWNRPIEADPPGGFLVSGIFPPIREKEQIQPIIIHEAGECRYIFDFGRNIAGWAEIEVQGKCGHQVMLRFGETLDTSGLVWQENLRGAKARDIYILKGKGHEKYKPRFTYHGFRYIQVETDPGVLIHHMSAYLVASDVRRIGSFHSSSPILDNIFKMIQYTEENNLHSVPTDCPQRDERLAWLNDMTVRFEEGLLNYDLILLYEKWLDDIADAQDPITGSLPDTAPFFYGRSPALHVSSVYILLPWFLYKMTGDKQALFKHYPGMKRYIEFLISQTSKGLIGEEYFGDWAPPMTESVLGCAYNAVPAHISNQLITTGYLYYDCVIMHQAADLQGFTSDAVLYAKKARQTMQAINDAFLRKGEGCYDSGSQGSNVFPLFLGIVPEDIRNKVLTHIISDLVDRRHDHLSTGSQTTKYLFEVLNQENQNEIACRIAVQSTYPGFGYMVANQATTIWERWEAVGSSMNSHDHPMHGSFATWFFKAFGGLHPDKGLLSDVMMISPDLPRFLSRAETTYETWRGRYSCIVLRQENRMIFRFHIPWNTIAAITLPGHPKLPILVNNQFIPGSSKQLAENGIIDFQIGPEPVQIIVRPGDYIIIVSEKTADPLP